MSAWKDEDPDERGDIASFALGVTYLGGVIAIILFLIATALWKLP